MLCFFLTTQLALEPIINIKGNRAYSVVSHIFVNSTILLHHVEAIVTIKHKTRGSVVGAFSAVFRSF